MDKTIEKDLRKQAESIRALSKSWYQDLNIDMGGINLAQILEYDFMTKVNSILLASNADKNNEHTEKKGNKDESQED